MLCLPDPGAVMPPKSQLPCNQWTTDPIQPIDPVKHHCQVFVSYTQRSTSEAATASLLVDKVVRTPTLESDRDTPCGKEPSMALGAGGDKEPSMASVLCMMSDMLQLSRNEVKKERKWAARSEEESAKWREYEEVKRVRMEKVREAEKIIDKIPAITEKQDFELFFCFRCGKPGNCAAECSAPTVGNEQHNLMHLQPWCFACGTSGHKSSIVLLNLHPKRSWMNQLRRKSRNLWRTTGFEWLRWRQHNRLCWLLLVTWNCLCGVVVVSVAQGLRFPSSSPTQALVFHLPPTSPTSPPSCDWVPGICYWVPGICWGMKVTEEWVLRYPVSMERGLVSARCIMCEGWK